MSDHSGLKVGQRFWVDGKAGTLLKRDAEWPEYDRDSYLSFRTEPDYSWTIQFDNGETKVYTQYTPLVLGMTYNPDAGYKVGDTFEVEREGLEPNLRGRLLEIDPAAEMWPYKIGQEHGVSVWFGVKEIRKIHSVVSRERAPKATESLKKQIAEKREELEALETALEVLEYASV